MLQVVTDIALLLVSASACLYCFLLSRRLKALQNLKKGLGASIVSLSDAIAKTSVAAQEARLSASESADKLTKLLADIDKSVPVVDDLIESISRSTRRAANETTRMQDEAVATVKPVLEDARHTASELAKIVGMINERSEKLQAQADDLDRRAAALAKREAEVEKAAETAPARNPSGKKATSTVHLHEAEDQPAPRRRSGRINPFAAGAEQAPARAPRRRARQLKVVESEFDSSFDEVLDDTLEYADESFGATGFDDEFDDDDLAIPQGRSA